jgi:DNA-binding PadR family transcriptional regulator
LAGFEGIAKAKAEGKKKGHEPEKLMLTADQRRALRLLVSAPRGASEALMLSYGFRRDMLAELVLGGLVTVVTETMRTGAATMKVERYRITESGREALRAARRVGVPPRRGPPVTLSWGAGGALPSPIPTDALVLMKKSKSLDPMCLKKKSETKNRGTVALMCRKNFEGKTRRKRTSCYVEAHSKQVVSEKLHSRGSDGGAQNTRDGARTAAE